MQTPGPRETLRFGDFELDVAAYELRRLGRPVKLGRQPMDLLILLVVGLSQIDSRNEIVDRLWGKDVFVDVDTGVNTAISKIRQVLRDSPDAPAFVETVPGKGYRFIAAVETIVPRADSAPAVPQPEPSPAPNQDVSGNGAEPGRSDGHPPSIPPVSSGSAVPATVETMRASGSRPGIRARLGIGLLIFAVGIGIVTFTRLKG